jgi:LysM repeat protein
MFPKARNFSIIGLFVLFAFLSFSTALADASTFTGSLAPGGSTEFVVALAAGSSVTATAVCSDGQVDPVLTVFDPNNTVIAINDDDTSFTYCPGSRYYSARVSFTAGIGGNYRFNVRNSLLGRTGNFTLVVDRTVQTSPTIQSTPQQFDPGDDRLNPDPVAPVAIYCRNAGIQVLAIDSNGQGHLAFFADFNEIARVGVPSVNTLIDSGLGFGLYRLTSGEFQLNGPARSGIRPKMLTQQQGDRVIHIVARGENLFRIALRYHTTVAAIAAANNIPDVTRIYVGQRLVITVGNVSTPYVPPVTTVITTTGGLYTVQTGDTVAIIAQRFNTTTSAIVVANGITNVNSIYPGQQLIIPGVTTGTLPTNPQTGPSTVGIGSGYTFIFNGC